MIRYKILFILQKFHFALAANYVNHDTMSAFVLRKYKFTTPCRPFQLWIQEPKRSLVNRWQNECYAFAVFFISRPFKITYAINAKMKNSNSIHAMLCSVPMIVRYNLLKPPHYCVSAFASFLIHRQCVTNSTMHITSSMASITIVRFDSCRTL